MAYQRPFLISMKKSEPQQPWGFRTFGGKEYETPHIVQKVLEDSNAEKCGLREGDEIIQIGRINVQDMGFGQVQEILARCGNKIEMFIVREDLLSPRKGKEPSFVKAVVHNPYNSPLNLYSTENIADTLAKQTEVLTGHISSAEEEEGPENLSFKQKSAVFQLLEEQARQENASQYTSKSDFHRKVVSPPLPLPKPKPKPPAIQNYQNKENFSPQDSCQIKTFTSTLKKQESGAGKPLQENYYAQENSVEPPEQQQKSVNHSFQSDRVSFSPVINHHSGHESYNSLERKAVPKVPTPPLRHIQSPIQETMATVHKQHSPYYTKKGQQYESEQETNYRGQKLCQQQEIGRQHSQKTPQQQTHENPQTRKQGYQHQQQQQNYQQVKTSHVESIFESAPQPLGAPMAYKAPPTQKHRSNWPPQYHVRQNGQWNSPSPTPASPTRNGIDAVWPPKQSTVKDLPKTGFNPAVIRDQGPGRKCVWPPPKPDDEFRSGRTTPQSPVSGRRLFFNPSPSPPLSRKAPFGSMSPVTRRKDINWPPPQPSLVKTETFHGPSPTFTRKARFDDYVKQHAACNVPSTYRAPPGTQHIEYC